MRLDEIFGFGRKKEPELKRADITPEEREMIARAFDFGHNAKLKKASGEYVLPGNVTLNYRRARVNFYKEGDQLMASVGWYSDEDGPGNPKKSPITTTDRKINSREDLYNLKSVLDDDVKQGSSVSHDSLRYKEMKRDLPGRI